MGQKEQMTIMSQIRGGIAGSDPRKISQRGAWIVLKQVHNLPPKGACLRLKVTIYLVSFTNPLAAGSGLVERTPKKVRFLL